MDYPLFIRQSQPDSNCTNPISCPDTPPTCNCTGANQLCQIQFRSCTQCAVAQCTAAPSTSTPSPGGGVSTGVLVGAILGMVVALSLAGIAFWYYRRRAAQRLRLTGRPTDGQAAEKAAQGQAITRPPNSLSTINIDAQNPFSDAHSSAVDSAISYVTPPPHGAEAYDSGGASLSHGSDPSLSNHPYGGTTSPTRTGFPTPARPERSPELSLRPPDPLYASNASVKSGSSSVYSDGESAITVELYDARTQSATRQVIGVAAKASLVPLNGNGSTTSLPRFPKSPLGQASFTAAAPSSEGEAASMRRARDPFADRPSSRASARTASTAATYDPDDVQILTANTFGGFQGSARSTGSGPGSSPNLSRSASLARASIVPLRAGPPALRSPAAHETAQAHAAAQRGESLYQPLNRRASDATTASGISGISTSSSLLSSFPFVPPSPLSPTHSMSPTSMHFSFRDGEEGGAHLAPGNAASVSHGLAPPTSRPVSNWSTASGLSAAPPHPPLPFAAPPIPPSPPPVPEKSRSNRALSTATSRASTQTTGSVLSAFPFHFGPSSPGVPLPLSPLPSSVGIPSAVPRDAAHRAISGEGLSSTKQGGRASLDSVVLSRQLGELGELEE